MSRRLRIALVTVASVWALLVVAFLVSAFLALHSAPADRGPSPSPSPSPGTAVPLRR